MRTRLLLVFLLLLSMPAAVRATCTNKASVDPQIVGRVDFTLTDECAKEPPIEEGDVLALVAGGRSIPLKVIKAPTTTTATAAGIDIRIVVTMVADPASDVDALQTVRESATADLKVGADDVAMTVGIVPRGFAANKTTYKWSIGPATAGDADSSGDTDSQAASRLLPVAQDAESDDVGTSRGAMRFQFAGEYARGGIFGVERRSRFQSFATLAIDTTDQEDQDFIDNNRATVGLGYTNLRVGEVFRHGRLAVEGRLAKALHSDVQDADAVVTLEGWVPVIPSVTLFSKTRFISAPLRIGASYGYRNKETPTDSYHGQVFEGKAIYHLFLLEQYSMDIEGTWTRNGLSNRPADVPRWQRHFKVTLSYLDEDTSGFRVLTTFENGSIGTLLHDVRQYFIGVGLSKIPTLNGGS